MSLPGFPPAGGQSGRNGDDGGSAQPDWAQPGRPQERVIPQAPSHPPPRMPTRQLPDGDKAERDWSDPQTDRSRQRVPRPRLRRSDQPKTTVTRVAAARTAEITRNTVRRIDDASRADGGDQTGLRTLIYSNAVSMGGDALVAVWLAATLFFAAPGEQQRGNVALYLLVTVAPFALIAPIVGPLLDRLDKGRRWTMAGTMVGRALMCWLLAAYDSQVVLYVAALFCLVLSRSYGVLKGAVVPRATPEGISLVTVNSRMTVFGMVAAGVLGAIGAGIIKIPFLGLTGELIFAIMVFGLGAYVSVLLPKTVDTDHGEDKANVLRAGTTGQQGRRGKFSLGTHIVIALRSTAAQKFLGGFLTFFLVFYIQSTLTGFPALAALGGVGVAAGAGSLIGTVIGTRMKGTSPDLLVLISTAVAVAFCVIAAVTPSMGMSIVVALIASIASALGKTALDAIVQREVPENLRSSAFSRSETVLQLAWVGGGALGIILPAQDGLLWLGFTVAAVVLVVAFGLTMVGRQRATKAGPQAAGISDRGPSTPWVSKLKRPRKRTGPSANGGPPPPPGRTSHYQPPNPRAAQAAVPQQDWRSAPSPGAVQATRPLPDLNSNNGERRPR